MGIPSSRVRYTWPVVGGTSTMGCLHWRSTWLRRHGDITNRSTVNRQYTVSIFLVGLSCRSFLRLKEERMQYVGCTLYIDNKNEPSLQLGRTILPHQTRALNLNVRACRQRFDGDACANLFHIHTMSQVTATMTTSMTDIYRKYIPPE